jgi:hypothetical protein
VLTIFAAGHAPTGNPRRGVLLSAGIACGTIALGELNVIAPVVSMFFLLSYGLLNYATYVEARANSPSFRPRFRWFHARLSLLGGAGCLVVMLAIHPVAAIAAVVLLFGIYQYVASSVGVDRWADSGRSQRFQRVREDLFAIAGEPEHPRYWRPVLLAFSDDPTRRERLLKFSAWLEGQSGLTTIVRLVEEHQGPRARRKRQEAEEELRSEVEHQALPAFPRAIVTDDPEGAIPVLLQAYGLGPVRANTVLVNWFDRRKGDGNPARMQTFGRRLRLGLRFGCNLVVLSAHDKDLDNIENTKPGDRVIDVWHRDNATGRLMLLLAYLMTRTETWEDARIRLFAPASKERPAEERLDELGRMLEEVRIVADLEIVETVDTRTVAEHSLNSSVVFLPMTLSDRGPACVYGELEDLLPTLGISALVLAAQDIELDAQPEEGKHGEIAQAVDEAEKAGKTARKTEEDAAETEAAARETQERLDQARAAGETADVVADLESAAKDAEQLAERSRRRTAKAKAKADMAAEEADALTGKPPTKKNPPPNDHG